MLTSRKLKVLTITELVSYQNDIYFLGFENKP